MVLVFLGVGLGGAGLEVAGIFCLEKCFFVEKYKAWFGGTVVDDVVVVFWLFTLINLRNKEVGRIS